MKIKIKFIIIIVIILILGLLFLALKPKIFPSKQYLEITKPITLNWWGVWETNDDVADLINGFKTLHPNITINYRKFRFEDYENELLEAFAEDRGPDLYSLPASWLSKYQTKILPQPPTITLPYQELKGALKKELVTTIKKVPTLTINQVNEQFVDVVSKDVVINKQIYGLPFNLDTLVLFYNRDLFNNFNIALPPKNWSEFADDVQKVTLIDQNNEIVQAGAAIGTAKNIPRANDILAVLMIQNGALMTADSGGITFNQAIIESNGQVYNPGAVALEFYTDFANPSKVVYTWNDQQGDALEEFIKGKVAMFFGYSYHLPLIKSKAPKLNFSVTNFPQIENSPVNYNYANYWVVTVAKKSTYSDEAWGFINYAIQKDVNKKFLEKIKRPTALKNLIDEQLANEEIPELKIFASQVLTAKSWYHGRNPLLAEKYFSEMIDNVVSGTKTPIEAINLAVQQINTTL